MHKPFLPIQYPQQPHSKKDQRVNNFPIVFPLGLFLTVIIHSVSSITGLRIASAISVIEALEAVTSHWKSCLKWNTGTPSLSLSLSLSLNTQIRTHVRAHMIT